VMMGWLGENQLAAHQIAINLASLTYMAASGIGVAGGIRVGEGRGLRKRHNIYVSGNVAFLMVVAFMTTCMLIFIFFDKQLISIYLNDPEVTQIAVKLLLIAAFFQLSDGVQVVGLGVLRGIEDVNVPTVLTMIAYWIIALPVGYYLSFMAMMDATGIWIGLWAGLTVSAVLLTIRFYFLLKKLRF
jgi:multidrug resistance protein, MATE family